MGVTPITSLAQFHEVINGSDLVIVDFWATWCGPCRVISPIFKKLSDGDKFTNVKFYSVDVDEQTEVAEEVGIRAMPTFYVFRNGDKIGTLVGADPNGLEELLVKQQANLS